jgi:transcription-repair coupling factor (superfamily II helicase)
MIEIVKIRWMAEEIGFEKLTLKNNTLKGYFVSAENESYYKSDKFGKILDHVKQNPRRCALREQKGKLFLQIENVADIASFGANIQLLFDSVSPLVEPV